MATADKTWATVPAGGMTDGGVSTSITYADVAGEGGKFTQVTKSTTSNENGNETATTETWGSWVGLGRIAVTSANIQAWSKKLVTNTKLTSHTVSITVLDAALSAILAVGPPVNAVSLATATDANYAAQTAGTNRAVNVGKGGANQGVRLQIAYSCVTGGTSSGASVDQRFNAITVRITYEPIVVAPQQMDGMGGYRFVNQLG